MTWSELPFGRYTGLPLPQVLFTDPGDGSSTLQGSPGCLEGIDATRGSRVAALRKEEPHA